MCAILINANHLKEHTGVNKLHRGAQKATAGSFNLKTTYISRNAAFVIIVLHLEGYRLKNGNLRLK